MAWAYLVIAGFFEWGWTDKGGHYGWLAFSITCMIISGGLLLVAQRTLPMGTAYAVWTGIGAVGTFILGIIIFGEAATLVRFFFVGLIIAGILGLKLVSNH